MVVGEDRGDAVVWGGEACADTAAVRGYPGGGDGKGGILGLAPHALYVVPNLVDLTR